MKKLSRLSVVVLVALLVAQPMFALAGSPVRVIPNGGKVSLMSDGKEVGQFRSEMPLQQGLVMVCSGSCLVQSQNLQLAAQDKAVLALSEAEKSWDLTIKSGRVDFAMRAASKPVTFRTPHDVIQTEQAIIPASTEGMVRGYVVVSEDGTELVVQEGALQVASSKGSQLVQAGHSIVLAQGDPGNNHPGSDKKKVAGGAILGGGSALTGTQLLVGGVLVGGAMAAGAATAESKASGNGNDVSPN